MKKIVKLSVVLSLLLAGIPELVTAQAWGGAAKEGFWNNWSFNANAGLTSFFGDLSVYDSDIMGKLTQESGMAASGILTKHFNDRFAMSGQLLYGSLKGAHNSRSFESSFVEYNFHGRINLVGVVWPDNLSPIKLDLYAGIGQFLFNTTSIIQSDEGTEVSQENTGTPEFVYFFGSGLSYSVGDRLAFTADIALRQAQNDKLDDFKKNDNYDYYTHISVGITYKIHALFNKGNSYSRGGNTHGRLPGRLPMRRRR
ncbi:MAG: hypothetical protein Kow00127_04570 [Bacteroidales bacterium]